MRIVVHDYSGHAFQVQLSRSLAQRGHQVLHLYSASFTTPQGPLQRRADDPPGFQPEPILLGERVDKQNLVRRRRADMEHGRRAVERIAAFKPEVVLSGNTPLDAQRVMLNEAQGHGVKFVFWVQDLIGQAALRLLSDRWMGLGKAVGAYYHRLEQRLLEQSDRIVVISEDFRPFLPKAVRDTPKVDVIENWAILDEIPVRPKVNPWSERQGATEGLTFLYSGTLGMKHNPDLLVGLAQSLGDKGRMIVVSEGASMDYLRTKAGELGLGNLVLLPFQPFQDLPDMLGSADVLVAILEPSAGVFSVPSKVLSYLCAGKPILLAVPPENLVARIVSENKAGVVVPPDDAAGFVAGAEAMAADASLRQSMGAGARAYAERAFDIGTITDRFERVLKV